MSELYGIKTVVGGFGRPMTAEESIPYTLARTYIEHTRLRNIFYEQSRASLFQHALEIGCGYGRNLPLLKDFSQTVTAFERDQQLAKIAEVLNPKVNVINNVVFGFYCGPRFDLIMTFTFLQHLDEGELQRTIEKIRQISMPGSLLLLVEETNPRKTSPGCVCRPIATYQQMLPEFSLKYAFPRKLEPSYPYGDSGDYMLFRKGNTEK